MAPSMFAQTNNTISRDISLSDIIIYGVDLQGLIQFIIEPLIMA